MVSWFRTKAEAGDHVAEFNYAVCLAKGLGVPRNDETAAGYLLRAAPHLASARYWYGMLTAEGRGVETNLAEARRHFGLAFVAGHTEAASALGEMLINGRGGPQDPALAVSLFKHAAARKHSGAMFALGVIHTGGNGIAVDLAAARGWFLAAAQIGHAQSRQILARFLLEGVGGAKDVEQARRWLDGPATAAAAHRIGKSPTRSAEPELSAAQ
jgi:hypothetical protein